MRRAWLAEAYFLVGLLAVALLGGGLLGGAGWWLSAALLALLSRHFWQLRKLERWLGSGRQRNPPESWGIWGEVFDDYFRLQKRYYKRKKRLAKVIREFRESTAAMPDGSLVLDGEHRILWFNAAAEDMLRLSSKRDLGQPVANLVRSPKLASYLQAGDYDNPVILRSPVDETRSLSVRLIPYGSNQYLALFRDVTRILRLQAMRRDFVANASHELRSPLTVLSGYLETLGEAEALDSEWHGPLDEMQHQCRRMSTLVDDLLELSRLETEDDEVSTDEVVEVPALLRRILNEARLQDSAGHRIEMVRCDSLGLLGLENELHSAFSNLVLNAVRYTGAGGRIQVAWYVSDNGEAVFEVIDEGIGIESRHLPFITQRFYRVDSARSRSGGGTGLGLAIVKHVLQRHRGRLDVESEPGRGSAFRCVFPPERTSAAQHPVVAEA
ncbi:MAG: phosphate regulon sensor histidine kinase PhoR [Wenzhouxiangella sp.]|jgi:two-component system phosphate regulon sensor histidine kinase PhoR|nr:phosphate regulon sensor histidine kinase PhoR [Wenzhouxiangella sp.]